MMASESADKFRTDYTDWLQKNRFSLDGCAIGISNPLSDSDKSCATGCRGVIATRNLPEGHVLFRVPSRLVLSVRTSQYGPMITKRGMKAAAALAVALCIEDKDKKSRWRGYLDALPSTLDMPLFWTQEQRRLLAGTRVVERANAEQVYLTYQQLAQKLCSYDEFVRMGSIILAYSFTMESTSGSKELLMLPFADMLNATPTGTNCRLFACEDGSFEMITMRAIRKGDELLNSYGTFVNAELLLRYGYTAVKNPSRGVAISLREVLNALEATTRDGIAIARAQGFVRSAKMKGMLPSERPTDQAPFTTSETIFVVEIDEDANEVHCPLLRKVASENALQFIIMDRLKHLDEAEELHRRLKGVACEKDTQRRMSLAAVVRADTREVLQKLLRTLKTSWRVSS